MTSRPAWAMSLPRGGGLAAIPAAARSSATPLPRGRRTGSAY